MWKGVDSPPDYTRKQYLGIREGKLFRGNVLEESGGLHVAKYTHSHASSYPNPTFHTVTMLQVTQYTQQEWGGSGGDVTMGGRVRTGERDTAGRSGEGE